MFRVFFVMDSCSSIQRLNFHFFSNFHFSLRIRLYSTAKIFTFICVVFTQFDYLILGTFLDLVDALCIPVSQWCFMWRFSLLVLSAPQLRFLGVLVICKRLLSALLRREFPLLDESLDIESCQSFFSCWRFGSLFLTTSGFLLWVSFLSVISFRFSSFGQNGLVSIRKERISFYFNRLKKW